MARQKPATRYGLAFQQVSRYGTDGAVLPILHLNGYKISNPTLLARITREELEQLLRGYGWTPYFVEGHEPALMHEAMATTLDTVVEEIKRIQHEARLSGNLTRPRWPMIVLNSPKGWTGPKVVDGLQVKERFVRTKCRSPIGHTSRTPHAFGRVVEKLSAAGTL